MGFADFLVELARALGPLGMLHLGQLVVGRTRAAQVLYLSWDSVVLDYMRAFNPNMRAHSPGNLCTLFGIRHFIEQGRSTYDFGRGDEPYKFVLGARRRDLAGVVITRVD